MFLDIETLRIIWWLLLGALVIGYAISSGFDLGVGILLRFVGHTDAERCALINSVDPGWEGNGVWFLIGAGVMCAAWPLVFTSGLSGFHVLALVLVIALILRPVGFRVRNRIGDPTLRAVWDWALFAGGLVPSLVFGIAMGNALQGVPFHFDQALRPVDGGTLVGLLNPLALLCGLVSLAMLTMHGGVFLAIKAPGKLSDRAYGMTVASAVALTLLFGFAGIWAGFGIDGYAITDGAAHDGASDPLAKTVAVVPLTWFHNYLTRPVAMLGSALGLIGPFVMIYLLHTGATRPAFIVSSAAIAGVVAAPGLAMFPFILPSSSHPSSSLTVWDASAGQSTLFFLLVAVVVVVPAVTVFSVRRFRARQDRNAAADIDSDDWAY
jgi:cytochrome d ubiquinol oxidase subunit II